MNNILKRYVELERARLNPREGDCSDVNVYRAFQGKVSALQAEEGNCAKKVTDAAFMKRAFKFETVGFLPLIITVLVAVLAMVFIDVGGVADNFALGGFRWVMYLILAAGLVVECIIMNEEDKFLPMILRIALFAVIAYLGWLRKEAIFGSDLNWILIYFVAAFVILLACRAGEYFKSIGFVYKVYDENCKYIEEMDKKADELANLYAMLGDKAAERQNAFMAENGITLTPAVRTPWLAFEREGNGLYGYGLAVDKGYDAKTNFKAKTEYHSTTGDSTYSWTIASQFLGFEDMTPTEALKMIEDRKLSALFEMGLPLVFENMECRAYRHTWEINYNHTMTYERTEWHADAKKLREFDDATERFEYNYYRGSADNYIGSSFTEEGYRQMYIDKRDKARKALHNQKVTKMETSEYNQTEKGDEIAFLEIYDPESGLRGFYVPNTVQAVDCTVNYLWEVYKYAPTAATVANNTAQRWYLYQRFLRLSDEKMGTPGTDSEYFKKGKKK